MEYICIACGVSIKGSADRLKQHLERVHVIEMFMNAKPVQRVTDPVRQHITITELNEAKKLLEALSWSRCLGLRALWYVCQNKRPTTINELAKFTRGKGPHGIEGLRKRRAFAKKLAKMLSSYGLLKWIDEKTLVPLVSQLSFKVTGEPKERILLDNISKIKDWLTSIYNQQKIDSLLLDHEITITFLNTSMSMHETKSQNIEKPLPQTKPSSSLELTYTQIDKVMQVVKEFTISKKCDHALMISLGFKSSFSEGAASVLLECQKCGKRIQQNI
jgi:hypothetical protein